MRARNWAGLFATFALAVILSYALAQAGEPSSAWLWGPIL